MKKEWAAYMDRLVNVKKDWKPCRLSIIHFTSNGNPVPVIHFRTIDEKGTSSLQE